jgi:hypothetical protein
MHMDDMIRQIRAGKTLTLGEAKAWAAVADARLLRLLISLVTLTEEDRQPAGYATDADILKGCCKLIVQNRKEATIILNAVPE